MRQKQSCTKWYINPLPCDRGILNLSSCFGEMGVEGGSKPSGGCSSNFWPIGVRRGSDLPVGGPSSRDGETQVQLGEGWDNTPIQHRATLAGGEKNAPSDGTQDGTRWVPLGNSNSASAFPHLQC